jgi:hypothetical protein
MLQVLFNQFIVAHGVLAHILPKSGGAGGFIQFCVLLDFYKNFNQVF